LAATHNNRLPDYFEGVNVGKKIIEEFTGLVADR